MAEIGALGAVRAEDGRRRCPWGDSTPEYRAYHDHEWGAPCPTTAYAAMQSLGLVNDHLQGCHARRACEDERRHITVR